MKITIAFNWSYCTITINWGFLRQTVICMSRGCFFIITTIFYYILLLSYEYHIKIALVQCLNFF